MYTLLIAFFLVSIIFSFFCSMWEAVLLSTTPSFADIKQREGTALGRHLAEFKANIDRPLAAILTLNTVAHTVGAIGVGSQATAIWSDSNPILTAFVIPVVMTLAILVLSEIIPKTIGATHWKRLVGFTVNSLLIIIAVLYPLVWLCQLVTSSLKKDTKGSIYSRSDFLAMAEIGAEEGVFNKSESEIIGNLLRFNRVCAKDIMTPRTVAAVAAEEQSIRSFFDEHETLHFSRIPVYEGTKDHITGYILKDELLAALVEHRDEDPMVSLRREITIIPEDFPLPELFSRFIESREHIALVVDQYGGMAGIVTMEDVIETLLGMEIVDEMDQDADMQILARRQWEKRARVRGLLQEKVDLDEPES
ncbi:MAG: CNNM domain-containing protein [Pseudomonadota bacterium]